MILCCGEALIDMIPAKTSDDRDCFVPHPGGAVFNTAVALGRVNAPVGMLTGLSTDLFGQQLYTALSDNHVGTPCVVRSSRPTTLAFLKIVEGQASYSFFDENSAGRMLCTTELPALPDDVCALYFGGISLACEPGAETYASLCIQQSETRPVMLDLNIRPSFIRDEAVYRNRLERMMRSADIIKVSDDDLKWLTGSADDLEKNASDLLRFGSRLVILTRGNKGATAWSQSGQSVSVEAPSATVVDTVGAGDTFNAGFLAKLHALDALSKTAIASLSDTVIARAMQYGARAAAVTVSRSGANPPWAHEL